MDISFFLLNVYEAATVSNHQVYLPLCPAHSAACLYGGQRGVFAKALPALPSRYEFCNVQLCCKSPSNRVTFAKLTRLAFVPAQALEARIEAVS